METRAPRQLKTVSKQARVRKSPATANNSAKAEENGKNETFEREAGPEPDRKFAAEDDVADATLDAAPRETSKAATAEPASAMVLPKKYDEVNGNKDNPA